MEVMLKEKCQGDNPWTTLLERHFPERIPPTERKSRPTKGCVVCYKNKRK
jgi:hypothetical protein